MTEKARALRKILLTTPVCSLLIACGGGDDSSGPVPTASTDTEINFVINAGEGFNDSTSAAPVGGNTGTTVGAQRLGVIREAARIWSAVLDIDTDIVLDVDFTDLECGSFQGVVGAANPVSVFQQFNGAPQANTWYVSGLADNLAGRDLEPGESDIEAVFNSRIGQAGCLGNAEFYYGFDSNNTSDQIDLLHIVLHEIGHGLGFISLIDVNSGELLNSRMDTFSVNLRDGNFTPFAQLTDSQRATSIRSKALWGGAAVTAAMDTLSEGPDVTPGGIGVPMHTPDPADEGSSLSHWSTTLQPVELMQPNTPSKGVRQLSALDMGSMRDMGWPLREDADLESDDLPDVWELMNGLNPHINDSSRDLDGDTLTNAQELSFGTAANSADTDGDTLTDADELNIYNTDPTKADTDGDGIPDNEEI